MSSICVHSGLEDSITAFRATHQSSTFWGRGNRKLLILIPLNANISHKLEDEDDSIHFYDNLPNNEIDRAGVRGRVYKHSVYRVQDEDGKVGMQVDLDDSCVPSIHPSIRCTFYSERWLKISQRALGKRQGNSALPHTFII